MCIRDSSYIGYDPVNVEATVGTFVKVVMKESSQTLNEVVVVGYGTQKKESCLLYTSMSIMQEQKMIDESLLLRYFEKEVNEEKKKKVEEWIHSSEANSLSLIHI